MSNDTTPQYKPGDIANGHRLTQKEDGTFEWVPVEAEPQPKPNIWREAFVTAFPKRPAPWILRTAVIIVGLIILANIAGGNRSDVETIAEDDGLTPGQIAEREALADEPEPAPTPEPEPVDLPDLAGKNTADVTAALTAVGLTLNPVYTSGDANTALATGGTLPIDYYEGDTVTVYFEVQMTIGQSNALRSAQSYLKTMGFSRQGLIEQLQYEQYSIEDATFAVDNAGADWGAEAAETAQSYMDTMAFSRGDLYDQLIYEGFTDAEANHGLAAVGY